jgi:hypothetical protein
MILYLNKSVCKSFQQTRTGENADEQSERSKKEREEEEET